MDFPLLDSVDGILLATYTDTLYDDNEDFETPCECPLRARPRPGSQRRNLPTLSCREHSAAQGVRVAHRG